MKKFKVALQLYSVRDEMEKDMESALRAVKAMGYDYVEFAGYCGHSAEEVRRMLDTIGLECVSVHQGYEVFLKNGEAGGRVPENHRRPILRRAVDGAGRPQGRRRFQGRPSGTLRR